ncbi:MAG: hypothetical protein H7Z13_14655 [Ferruginibacter sp.]|nr:hypothetical protein [Ferruginibacter sp.]
MKKWIMGACFAISMAGISFVLFAAPTIFQQGNIIYNAMSFQKKFAINQSFFTIHFYSINPMRMNPARAGISFI